MPRSESDQKVQKPSVDAVTHLDPFHLVALSEDIDNQCQRIVARDFPKVVDEKALHALKVELRDQFASLLTEMLNEWRHLAEQVDDVVIFDEEWVLPGVPEMASQLPQIYGRPPDATPETLKAWHVERVRWTVRAWMDMWMHIFAYLPKAENGETPDPILTTVPTLELTIRPFQVYAVMRIWQMLRILSLEYLAKKADLLFALGQSGISVDINEETSSPLHDAKEAFWRKRSDAPILLILAVRYVLIEKLDAAGALRALSSHMPTSVLLTIAADSGLKFSNPINLLRNLLHDLERHQDTGDRLELSYFYPVFRILTRTVEELQGQDTSDEVARRAAGIFARIVSKYAHENNPQD